MLQHNKIFWQKNWQRYLHKYLSGSPRTGIFIKDILKKEVMSMLEIACGSSRDSIYLTNSSYNVIASDFDEKTLHYLKNNTKFNNLNYVISDAFDLPFNENSFDLVFNNGLFIYFSDDNSIIKMLKEQERISRKYIFIFVHNKLNKKLINKYKLLSRHDKLYDIRFFNPQEIESLIIRSDIKPKSLKFLKFGGKVDIFFNSIHFFYDKLGFRPIKKMYVQEMILPKLYQMQKWEATERIACIVELKK